MQERRIEPWNQDEPPNPDEIAVGDRVGLWFGAVGDRFCHRCRVVGKDGGFRADLDAIELPLLIVVFDVFPHQLLDLVDEPVAAIE